MALEQWEKELRQQLAVVKTKNEPWEDDLIEEIRDMDLPHSRKKDNTTFFVGWLVFLGILTVFAYDNKTGDIREWWQTQNFAVVPLTPRKSYDKDIADIQNTLREGATHISALSEDLQKLQAKTKWNSERITLTGLILNENSMIFRNNYDKNHLIFFNRDWTINQMPHYLQLTEADKEYLQKYIVPHQSTTATLKR